MNFQSSFPRFSLEFFPPKSEEAADKLYKVISEYESFQPQFVSITYGAGGSTRNHTHQLVGKIQLGTSLTPIPHLTCIKQNSEELETILQNYAKLKVPAVLALRGDSPKNEPHYNHHRDEFVQAKDLVNFIQQFNKTQSHHLQVGVAGFPEGHPQTPNRLQELAFLKEKVDCGADYICTQLFFDNHTFFDFQERCLLENINIPIVAGIMPITSFKNLQRMAELSAGTVFPAKLLQKIQPYTKDEDIEKVGIEYTIKQCKELINYGVNNLHFYTLNQSRPILPIIHELNLQPT